MSASEESLQILNTTLPMKTQDKPRFTRSRNGCLCCRIRKKKCDGHRPTCAGCQRNDLICSWPEQPHEKTTNVKLPEKWSDETMKAQALANIESRAVPSTCATLMPVSIAGPLLKSLPRIELVQWPMKNFQLRNPSSYMLFQHFYEIMIPIFAPTTFSNNPFYRYVLPYADTDPKVVHVLLALSGSCVFETTKNQMLYTQSLEHYSISLRNIKTSLKRCQAGESTDILRLFLSCLLLCFREGIDGSNDGSTLFVHLRAARECALWFTKNPNSLPPAEREMLGFLMEYYAYCVLSNRVTFDTDTPLASLLDDQFILSLKYLQTVSSPGVLFGCAYELYEVIPQICRLAQARKDNTGKSVYGIGDYTFLEFTRLHHVISSWERPNSQHIHGIELQVQLDAARTVQLCMLIFLHAAFYNDDPGSTELKAKIRPLILEGLPLLQKVSCSPMCTAILWACTVMASCLSDPDHQEYCLQGAQRDTELFALAHIKEIINIVICVWNDPDESVFGPAGIAHVTKKRGIILNVI